MNLLGWWTFWIQREVDNTSLNAVVPCKPWSIIELVMIWVRRDDRRRHRWLLILSIPCLMWSFMFVVQGTIVGKSKQMQNAIRCGVVVFLTSIVETVLCCVRVSKRHVVDCEYWGYVEISLLALFPTMPRWDTRSELRPPQPAVRRRGWGNTFRVSRIVHHFRLHRP